MVMLVSPVELSSAGAYHKENHTNEHQPKEGQSKGRLEVNCATSVHFDIAYSLPCEVSKSEKSNSLE